MTDEPLQETAKVLMPVDMEGVKAFIHEIIENDRKKAEALADEQTANVATAKLRKQIVDPLDENTEMKITAIREYFLVNKRTIRDEIGKTIPAGEGVIRWFVRERVDLPKDTGPIIKFLLKRRYGRRALEEKYAIKKDALKSADRRLQKKLRDFYGVFIGDVEHLTLSIVTRKDPIQLHEERLARRQPRATK
jgi:hypothetical protein